MGFAVVCRRCRQRREKCDSSQFDICAEAWTKGRCRRFWLAKLLSIKNRAGMIDTNLVLRLTFFPTLKQRSDMNCVNEAFKFVFDLSTCATARCRQPKFAPARKVHRERASHACNARVLCGRSQQYARTAYCSLPTAVTHAILGS